MYYWVLVSVYYTAAGYAYLVSVIVPAALAQLVGVVTIFANSMFAGGAPVLKQLWAVRVLASFAGAIESFHAFPNCYCRQLFIPLRWFPIFSFGERVFAVLCARA
jgi:hypothetical protein